MMVMFTLARTADTLKLNTPYTIPLSIWASAQGWRLYVQRIYQEHSTGDRGGRGH